MRTNFNLKTLKNPSQYQQKKDPQRKNEDKYRVDGRADGRGVMIGGGATR